MNSWVVYPSRPAIALQETRALLRTLQHCYCRYLFSCSRTSRKQTYLFPSMPLADMISISRPPHTLLIPRKTIIGPPAPDRWINYSSLLLLAIPPIIGSGASPVLGNAPLLHVMACNHTAQDNTGECQEEEETNQSVLDLAVRGCVSHVGRHGCFCSCVFDLELNQSRGLMRITISTGSAQFYCSIPGLLEMHCCQALFTGQRRLRMAVTMISGQRIAYWQRFLWFPPAEGFREELLAV